MSAAQRVTPRHSVLLVLALSACAARATPLGPAAAPAPSPAASLLPQEAGFVADLRQLTFGGENAEAYFSFDGRRLSFQARQPHEGCDRIYRLDLTTPGARPEPVSSGAGATTCAHFFPGDELVFSSTHLAGPACPPRPDMSQGYVWALHGSYDVFATGGNGEGGLRRLTDAPGYDAEATVCGKDGSVVFTSMRDGDLELYRMDRDGRNVRRLTRALGYDGGAFFNRDCTKIVWRASRPRSDAEARAYKDLLGRGLVRPSKLELWTANADGSDAVQLTYLDAASFAPFFHPTEELVLFSSNYGDPKGREFDIWAIRPNGTGLVRVTHTPGFDGFPHVSPDGRWLAFSSNRATPPGGRDTNVFLARWKGPQERAGAAAPKGVEGAADRIARDVLHLAAPEREGRGLGTTGLAAAGAYLEGRLRALGLEPAGDDGSFRQAFPVTTAVEPAPATRIEIAGRELPRGDFSVLGFSASARARGPLAFAGYGIVDPKVGLDDYAGLDVKGKIVVVRRFAPEGERYGGEAARRRLGDLRRKAWLARERGAAALLVVDVPAAPAPAPADWKLPAEAPLVLPQPEGPGDAGLPVVMVKRQALETILPTLTRRGGRPAEAAVAVELVFKRTEAFNVVGRISAGRREGNLHLVLGAHYDHLGFGGRHSLAPERHEPHLGADDNASGTAAALEIARALMARRAELRRDVVVALFSGEESGLLGSAHYVRERADALKGAVAMINLDMVGRLRGNLVDVLGTDSATEWRTIVEAACREERVECRGGGDGHGPSDQASFYGAGVPVLHFFTGAHADYHKPTDRADRVNAAGAAAVARVAENVLRAIDVGPRLSYQRGSDSPTQSGDARSFNASLGTIPDYAGPPGGAPGVLLSGVRSGGAADRAGLRRGDVLVKLGRHEVRSVEDLMYALNAAKPGETVTAIVKREGKPLSLEVTYQEAQRRR